METPHAMIDTSTFRLDGRVALVTGSSAGIGLALARGLGQAGATVVLNGRDAARLEAARAALAAEGLAVQSRRFDVCDAAAVDAAVQAIETEVGAIEILVNNAGITRRGAFHELPAADWQAVLHTNVDSLFVVGQAVARRMVPRGRGRIINTCSVMSELGRPGTAAYTASKGAVKMLTKGMAIDLGPHGINVNGIGPGYFKTELTASLAADPAFNDWLLKRTPSRRWGEVEDLRRRRGLPGQRRVALRQRPHPVRRRRRHRVALTMTQLTTVILFTDTDGRARFREEAVALDEGKPQAMLSALQPSGGLQWRLSPVGFRSSFHCTETPQWVFILGGQMEIGLQDGSSRVFQPGQHFYSDDRLPQGAAFDDKVHGHWSRQVGPDPLVTVFVRG